MRIPVFKKIDPCGSAPGEDPKPVMRVRKPEPRHRSIQNDRHFKKCSFRKRHILFIVLPHESGTQRNIHFSGKHRLQKTRDIVQSLKNRGDSETEDLAVITDEYGWIIKPEEFIELVENSRKPRGPQNTRPRKRDHCRRDNEGWDFYDDKFS